MNEDGPPLGVSASPSAVGSLGSGASARSAASAGSIGSAGSLCAGLPWRGSGSPTSAGLWQKKPTLRRRKTSLSEDIAPELLRGVRIDKALQRMGALWTASTAPTGEDKEREFSLSTHVTKLHDFISHDWSTGRWVKFWALCYIYNRMVTVFTTLLFAGTFFALFMKATIPKPPVTDSWHRQVAGQALLIQETCIFLPTGIAVFWFTFLYGQALRGLAHCMPRRVFVDKVCINQSDPDQKASGIRSLAGFLSASDRLVVLWSPRYFTRLWCVYEIASWLRIKDVFKWKKFMPVSWAVALLLLNLTTSLLCCLLRLCWLLNIGPEVAFSLCCIICALLAVHGLRRIAAELADLPRQLGEFRIQDAQCFCCSCDHEDPVTGVPVPCDRDLVYSQLAGWFSNSAQERLNELSTPRSFDAKNDDAVRLSASQAAALSLFNLRVRTDVQHAVVEGRSIVKMRYLDAIFVIFPFILHNLDTVLFLKGPSDQLLQWLAFVACACLCVSPCFLKLMVLCVFRSTSRGWNDYWSTIIIASLCIFCLVVTFVPLVFLVRYQYSAPFWCLICSFVILTIALFWRTAGLQLEAVANTTSEAVGEWAPTAITATRKTIDGMLFQVSGATDAVYVSGATDANSDLGMAQSSTGNVGKVLAQVRSPNRSSKAIRASAWQSKQEPTLEEPGEQADESSRVESPRIDDAGATLEAFPVTFPPPPPPRLSRPKHSVTILVEEPLSVVGVCTTAAEEGQLRPPPAAAEAPELWKVVRINANVRKNNSTDSDIVGIKSVGDHVRGWQMEDWVKLVTEAGFIKIQTANGLLLERCHEEVQQPTEACPKRRPTSRRIESL